MSDSVSQTSSQSEGERDPVDRGAVQAAKAEIQNLAQEIAELSRQEIGTEAYFEAFLNKVVLALAAPGGAVWLLGDGGLRLQYQMNLRDTGLATDPTAQQQHGRLITQVMKSGEGTITPPHSGEGEAVLGDETAAANPTQFLLVLAPVQNDQGPQGVVEIFQRTGARTATQRGYLRFLEQMCELASDYLKSQRLRSFTTKQSLWEQLESFTRIAHQTLDLRQTAYSIANEGRRLIGCDRVSVAIERGGKCRIESVSGQDTFDKRSNAIRLLEKLARSVTKSRDDVWYQGDTSDLSPQVEKAIDSYVDESHSKAVIVLPLFKTVEESTDMRDRPAPIVVGALIVEQMVDSQTPDGLEQRVNIVREHSATAITNALEHNSIFLISLWKLIGKLKWLVRAKTLPKTLAVTAAVVGFVLWLCLWPATFELEARGKMVPQVRQNVFAEVDGKVDMLLVKQDQPVTEGMSLLKLSNFELESRLTTAIGKRNEAEKNFAAVNSELSTASGMSEQKKIELHGQKSQLETAIFTAKAEENLIREQIKLLQVKSPIDGRVISSKLEERLLGRPVNRGQILMEVAQTGGIWEFELYMPEHRMGHIAAAIQKSGKEQLPVTFILATSPEEEHVGQVIHIAATAEIRGEDGNTVLIRVLPEDQPSLQKLIQESGLRPGAEVIAKVDCGTASIGYVWLHDVVGWFRSKVLFRF